MTRLLIAIGIILTTIALSGQVKRQVYKPTRGSPDEVLDRYFKMINDGALLTPEGWKRAAALFVHPNPAPRESRIIVTTKFPLGRGPISIDGDKTEAWEKWVDDLGAIDTALRYEPPPRSKIELEGEIRIYKLVLTDKHWKIGEDGRSLQEVTGPREWKIENSLTVRSASREAAILYVKRMRDEASDPTIIANAEKTLAILHRLPTPRSHN